MFSKLSSSSSSPTMGLWPWKLPGASIRFLPLTTFFFTTSLRFPRTTAPWDLTGTLGEDAAFIVSRGFTRVRGAELGLFRLATFDLVDIISTNSGRKEHLTESLLTNTSATRWMDNRAFWPVRTPAPNNSTYFAYIFSARDLSTPHIRLNWVKFNFDIGILSLVGVGTCRTLYVLINSLATLKHGHPITSKPKYPSFSSLTPFFCISCSLTTNPSVCHSFRTSSSETMFRNE